MMISLAKGTVGCGVVWMIIVSTIVSQNKVWDKIISNLIRAFSAGSGLD